MNSYGKPKRQWFQIHLSTALVVLGVGGAMWYPFGSVLDEITNNFHNTTFIDAPVVAAVAGLILMLVSVAAVCERSIRRHESRRMSGMSGMALTQCGTCGNWYDATKAPCAECKRAV